MNWFVYILLCNDGTLYTGVTTNLERRFAEHREGKTGAKYTRGRFPLDVVYKENFASRSEAQVREHAIKKLSKKEKIILIKEYRKSSKRKITK